MRKEKEASKMWLLDFICLVVSALIHPTPSQYCNANFIAALRRGDAKEIKGYNWTEYTYDTLVAAQRDYRTNKSRYTGPLVFLVLLYVEKCKTMDWVIQKKSHPLEVWDYDLLHVREAYEMKAGGFGGGKKINEKLKGYKNEVMKKLNMEALSESSKSEELESLSHGGDEGTSVKGKQRKGKEVVLESESRESLPSSDEEQTSEEETFDSDSSEEGSSGKGKQRKGKEVVVENDSTDCETSSDEARSNKEMSRSDGSDSCEDIELAMKSIQIRKCVVALETQADKLTELMDRVRHKYPQTPEEIKLLQDKIQLVRGQLKRACKVEPEFVDEHDISELEVRSKQKNDKQNLKETERSSKGLQKSEEEDKEERDDEDEQVSEKSDDSEGDDGDEEQSDKTDEEEDKEEGDNDENDNGKEDGSESGEKDDENDNDRGAQDENKGDRTSASNIVEEHQDAAEHQAEAEASGGGERAVGADGGSEAKDEQGAKEAECGGASGGPAAMDIVTYTGGPSQLNDDIFANPGLTQLWELKAMPEPICVEPLAVAIGDMAKGGDVAVEEHDDEVEGTQTQQTQPGEEGYIECEFTTAEREIHEWIGLFCGNPREVLFKYGDLEVPKLVFESMLSGCWMSTTAIDCWAIILNMQSSNEDPPVRERHRRPRRFFAFFSTTMDCITSKDGDEEVRKDRFLSNLSRDMGFHKNINRLGIDLFFFPVMNGDHMYIVCFDLRYTSIEIIDNVKHPKSLHLEDIYGERPEILRNNFASLLALQKHPKAAKIKKAKPKRIQMPWRVKKWSLDSGAFMLRHMETYHGGGWKDWKCGLSTEDNETLYQQLQCLRSRYIKRILLWEGNENRDRVLNILEEFRNLQPAEKDYLKTTWYARFQERSDFFKAPPKNM